MSDYGKTPCDDCNWLMIDPDDYPCSVCIHNPPQPKRDMFEGHRGILDDD